MSHRATITVALCCVFASVTATAVGPISSYASVPPTSTENAAPTSTAVPATTSAAAAGDAVPDPGLVRLGDLLSEDDGRLPVETALVVFAAAVAPLPGVVPIEHAEQLPPGAVSMAIRRLAAERGALAPEVVAAVDAALEPQPGDIAAVIEPGAAPADTASGLSATSEDWRTVGSRRATMPPEELRRFIADYVAELTRRSGHELSIPIHARIVPPTRIGRDDGVTTGMGPISNPTGCRLLLNSSLFTSGLASDHITSTALHEVWHCFQLDSNAAAYESGPEWIIEGQAEWAGEEPVGGSGASAAVWDTWLGSPERSLFRRSYDAIGIYAVAASSGADPWHTMLPMLGQGNVAAVETLFGTGGSEAVLATASALVRAPERGAEWESFGPGITDAQGAPVMAIPDGAPATVRRTVGRFASLPVVLTVTAGDIARVSVVGGTAAAVELPGTDIVTLAPGGTASFCLRPEGCLCPGGSPPGGGAPLPAASPGEGAAAIGAIDGGELAVTAVKVTLEESCQTIVGTWVTTFEAALQAGTAPYGGVGMACTGPLTITYTAEENLVGSSTATCQLEEMTALLEVVFTATYTADATTVQVANFVAEGTVTIEGVTMAAPFPSGPSGIGAGTYTIVGDALTLTTTTPDGHTVTLTLTRAA